MLAGYPELDGRDVYNAAILVGPDGAPIANARKTHLFGAEEKRLFTPGETLTVARRHGAGHSHLLRCGISRGGTRAGAAGR